MLVAANAYAYGCTVLMEPDVRRKLRKTAVSKARKGARAVTRAPRQIQKRITRRRKGATTAPGATRGSRAKRDARR